MIIFQVCCYVFVVLHLICYKSLKAGILCCTHHKIYLHSYAGNSVFPLILYYLVIKRLKGFNRGITSLPLIYNIGCSPLNLILFDTFLKKFFLCLIDQMKRFYAPCGISLATYPALITIILFHKPCQF